MENGVDLANRKDNAASVIEAAGQKASKDRMLRDVIPEKYAREHEECVLHVHDLAFYDVTYNCIGVHVEDLLRLSCKKCPGSFGEMLRFLSRGMVLLTNSQSGGIGLMNFDADAAAYLTKETDEEITEELNAFFQDLNIPSRRGCERPYVTLNLGLDATEKGRRVTRAVLAAFRKGDPDGKPFLFPNIVFKLRDAVNRTPGNPNYDLYQEALAVTAECMIPTYFNCDAKENRDFAPEDLGVMGCRTRIASNLCGTPGAFHRGNVACVTINLVQLALKAGEGNLQGFLDALDRVLPDAEGLLLHRFEVLCSRDNPGGIKTSGCWMDSESGDARKILSNGTLSIGFIGLWDALRVLHHESEPTSAWLHGHFDEAYGIARRMRDFTDAAAKRNHLNFSLLASSAEGVTGRFAAYDREHLGRDSFLCTQGYYTNSFHVPVTVPVSYLDKIALEGPFHALCNGGCITYVEFAEMPFSNTEAVQDAVDAAAEGGCSYFGVNFPLDFCRDCGTRRRLGTECPVCRGKHIVRLRRVSGYLSEESNFTTGKRREMEQRVSHIRA